jgi:hypothetical protein
MHQPKTYALSDVAGAHEALEHGRSAGAIVLRPQMDAAIDVVLHAGRSAVDHYHP